MSVNRYLLHAGERIEIVVDFKNEEGKSVDLKAYNSTLANNVGGGENFTTGPFGNFLGKKDFNLLHINERTDCFYILVGFFMHHLCFVANRNHFIGSAI